MPKRFTDTELWNEDWFLEMPMEYKLFWSYIRSICNHAGILRPNKKLFESSIGKSINLKKFLSLMNEEKERIIVLENGRWFITGFILFQYGKTLNTGSKMHQSIVNLLEKNLVPYKTTSYGFEVKARVKDKDKDKEKVIKGSSIIDSGENQKLAVSLMPQFESEFWKPYDKKVHKPECYKKWLKLSIADKQKVKDHVPEYVKSQPDKQYRKNPKTYLNQGSWNDEIIERNNQTGKLFNTHKPGGSNSAKKFIENIKENSFFGKAD